MSKGAAKKIYKARKKANARGHRARTKGSVKARGTEFFENAPRRSRRMVGGAAVYTYGNLAGSRRAQVHGSQMFVEGFRGATGRSRATYKMSKGLKKSRNRAAKDAYYRDIGTSRKKRNAMKAAAVVGVVATTAVAYKKNNLGGYVHVQNDSNAFYMGFGKDMWKRKELHYVKRVYKNGKHVDGGAGAIFGKPFSIIDVKSDVNKRRASAKKKAQRYGFVV